MVSLLLCSLGVSVLAVPVHLLGECQHAFDVVAVHLARRSSC